jgi:hypothetical protein
MWNETEKMGTLSPSCGSYYLYILVRGREVFEDCAQRLSLCVWERVYCVCLPQHNCVCLGVESTRKMRRIYRLGRSATFLHATELLVSSAGLFGRSSLQEEKVVNVNNRRCSTMLSQRLGHGMRMTCIKFCLVPNGEPHTWLLVKCTSTTWRFVQPKQTVASLFSLFHNDIYMLIKDSW